MKTAVQITFAIAVRPARRCLEIAMPIINPMVVDLSHHNTIDTVAGGFVKVKASGIRGIIHKSSQGRSMVDGTYASRRKMATDAGLLWGAYHFGDNSDVDSQVRNFLHAAAPDDNTLMALDYEPNGQQTMTLAQARGFITKLEAAIGRQAVVYSGNLIKEQLTHTDAFFGARRLWLAQYGAIAKCPVAWDAPWLWQFTGDGSGPKPHSIPGIVDNGLDINSYSGTPEQLAAEWSGKPPPATAGVQS